MVRDTDTLFYVVNMLRHTAKTGKKNDFLECSAILGPFIRGKITRVLHKTRHI